MTPELLLKHADEATLWPAGSGLDVGLAYERALSVRQLRLRRGEQPRGYKIGFTNRTIWDRYGVYAPIWGTVWNTTLSFCDGEGELSLAGSCQPRIEPECVFGLKATPPARAGLDELLACIEWLAPGFEIVQSHCRDWKFTAADTVADSGLHARLLVGRQIDVASLPREAAAFDAQLAAARITLLREEVRVDAGVGANVLDGPLHALAHFLAALRDCPGATDLQPGDVVTTGTWTDAWPVHRGEQWRAEFDAPLAPLAVRFV
ncbi:hydratase [Ramlibacter sp.]|uniref:2-keto-4-pentenoate hydratase n=1 Tax=Ramlibacter sp. TaxID=1917967 RepID=UPI00261C06C6|nr:hydratase [Ramlibacter sp.]MDB5956050.1 4-oxalocrotonate decarboxylase-like protein [Ramlibacter sp.]